MHFSIPDTQELRDNNNNYVAYNIHINGLFHCTLRYKQLYSFHEQVKKAFGVISSLPVFPPKRFLSLTPSQTEERRAQLEKYIQIISQDQRIVNSELFNGFLLNAQQETQNAMKEEVVLNIYQMNSNYMKVKVLSNDRTDIVLQAFANSVDLSPNLLPYFCIYIFNDNHNNHTPIRRLYNFESPYLSLKTLNSINNGHYFVVRKSYWDSTYDNDILSDRVSINLLFYQTVFDIENGFINSNKDSKRKLIALQQTDSKLEYIHLARTLKFYGYFHFEPCFCDYPQPNTRVNIAAGDKELNVRAIMTNEQTKELNFRVTRIRCWRLTTSLNDKINGCASNESGSSHNNGTSNVRYELSFEYLISKDNLQWITIISEQAILMSVCLQGMVEELLMKRNGCIFKREEFAGKQYNRRGSWSYMKRDGSSHNITLPRSVSTESGFSSAETSNILKSSHSYNVLPIKTRSLVENDAFDGIGDDDL